MSTAPGPPNTPVNTNETLLAAACPRCGRTTKHLNGRCICGHYPVLLTGDTLFDAQEALARLSIVCDRIFPDVERAIGTSHPGLFREWVDAITDAAVIVTALSEERKQAWREQREWADA